MATELYKKYRPKSFKTVVGQTAAVSALQKMLEKGAVPHAILLVGPSGCGKTTVARILKDFLGCGDSDCQEINCADFKGIDTIREVRRAAAMLPIEGSVRVWIIDEAHSMTKDAQNALLKVLEDTPSHAYFFLATTDPTKLLATVRTRCMEVKLGSMKEDALRQVLDRVLQKEGKTVAESILETIVETAEGSARKALVLLEQVIHLDGEEEQMAAIYATTFDKDAAINLARALMFGKAGWEEVAKHLRTLAEQDVEGIRYLILGYARACMVGKGDKPVSKGVGERAFKIIDIFGRHMYDSKQAGLAGACWEAVHR